MANLHFKRDSFLDEKESQEYFDILRATVDWQVFQPSPNSRKVFRYSPPTDFDPIIDKLIAKIETDYKTNVIGVFMNLYENGGDYCPYHKDMYGADVYTISLGSPRDLLIKQDGRGTRAEKIPLSSGDLYYMAVALHHNHRHSIPKRKNAGTRISVVFFTQ